MHEFLQFESVDSQSQEFTHSFVFCLVSQVSMATEQAGQHLCELPEWGAHNTFGTLRYQSASFVAHWGPRGTILLCFFCTAFCVPAGHGSQCGVIGEKNVVFSNENFLTPW